MGAITLSAAPNYSWINLIILGAVFLLFFWGFSIYAGRARRELRTEVKYSVPPEGAEEVAILLVVIQEETGQPLDGLEIRKLE